LAKSIGIRCSEKGFRALEIESSFLGISITRIGSSHIFEDCRAFLNSHAFEENIPVAVGLVPGDFLSVTMKREEYMDNSDMENHLKWEIRQKMISDPSEYNYDFVVSKDVGFMFAGRKILMNSLGNTFGHVISDVEPVALLNGCEGAGETGKNTCLLISAEAEGISTVMLQNGNPVALESFPIKKGEYSEKMPGLHFDGSEKEDGKNAEELSGYIEDSLKRLSALCGDKTRPTPESIVLAGGGAYIDGLAIRLGNKIGIPVIVSDPFKSQKVYLTKNGSQLESMGAAFTTCFGLALRALEG
jgi:hypothetical protein